eukprot:CAMPEP_0119319810 /NCGR_PEP_ID=MMETSP1333-20130426/50407_1 /TAXON_ID=418940 /ORGANISM="Scyphosphaera apsteinii, Strain RCC1455" /LENGTH=298 /DNA_ID=CAMNT_0007326311 /DNA_START=79 /DNA_END=975 /DNA_ORIENTATION=+
MSLLWVLYKTLVRTAKNPTKYGKWAIVTGATDGIGKAMSFELASRGCSIMLVSRSAEKLSVVKEELAGKYPSIEVLTEAADFANLSEARRLELQQAIESLEVGVLVNNLGLSYPFCQWFDELSDSEVTSLLALNVDSMTWMTRMVLPNMLKRCKGAIVNLSSAAAQAPLPLLAQYSACKGYVENFSRSLSAEYRPKGIDIQCQSPLWVATSMALPNSKAPVDKRATLMMPTAKAYARVAVSSIGYETMACPYWAHALFMWVQARFPDLIRIPVIFRMHKKVRYHKKNVALMEKKHKGL